MNLGQSIFFVRQSYGFMKAGGSFCPPASATFELQSPQIFWTHAAPTQQAMNQIKIQPPASSMVFRSYAPEIKIYAIQILPNGQSQDLIWNSLGYSISGKSFKRCKTQKVL